jgi:phosphatidylserine decarboxylase
LVGGLADLPVPRFLRSAVYGAFSGLVGVDLGEVEKRLADYPSLGAFFVRRLRPGLRPMPDNRTTIVSPVDGQLASFGRIEGDRLVQVKGLHYSLGDLVDDADVAPRFHGGFFATIYLSPRDYHRIHAPCAGKIAWARHVPGRLFPVNRPSVAVVPDLFARNERVMCSIDTARGSIFVAAVGALNVGRISSVFDRAWNGPRGGVGNRRGAKAETRRYDPPVTIDRGDDLMAFHLGSTVVLLFEPGAFRLQRDLREGSLMRVGQTIAHPEAS